MGDVALREVLRALVAALRELRSAFAAGPRPSVEALTEATRKVAAVRSALEELGDGAAERLDGAGRLEVAHAAAEAQAELAVLARLAAGGAAFTQLARELDATSRRFGVYGPGGAQAPSTPASSIEHKV